MKYILFIFLSSYCLAENFYVVEHAPSQDYYREFDGTDLKTANSLASADGYPYAFLDQTTYATQIAAQNALIQSSNASRIASIQAYVTELSTTQTALNNIAPNLVAPTAIQQQTALRLLARITQLKLLLGQ